MKRLDSSLGPNFFLIGAAKAGTTFLAGLLDQHEDIFISKPKEPQFFNRYWSRGWDWYATHFRESGRYKFRGDASTLYSAIDTFPDCIGRIKAYCPDAKIIYIVRDPLPRIATAWKTSVRSSGVEWMEFEPAIRNRPIFVDSTQYWKQYSAYREQFGEDKIQLLFFEDFIQDPIGIANECAEFLGASVPFKFDLKSSEKNAAEKMRSPRSTLRWIKKNVKIFNHIYAASPSIVQSLIRTFMKKEIQTPVYTPELRNWVLSQIRPDSIRLLQYFGKPLDFWDVD